MYPSTKTMSAEYEMYSADREDTLVRQHLPLVKRIAQQLLVRLPSHIEMDDLIQVGLIGLLKAAESHQRNLGAAFSTYATIRIRGAMLDELRSRDWLPRSVQRDLSRVAAAIDRVEQQLGRPPADKEIADELGMGLGEYRELLGELSCARISQLDDTELLDDSAGPVDEVFDEARRGALVKAIEQLPAKEGLILSLYYTDGLNLKEIGMVLNVSESRVSQIHGQAVARLRARLKNWM